MKLNHLRPICRATNRFSPSLALYLHFVVPYNALLQQRLSSSASAPDLTRDAPPPELTPSSEDAQARQVSANHDPVTEKSAPGLNHVPFRKYDPYPESTDRKKPSQSDNKKSTNRKKTSQSDNKKLTDRRKDTSSKRQETLMMESKVACNQGGEYTGQVFTCFAPPPAQEIIPEPMLPWARTSFPRLRRLDPMQRLDREINDFWEYIKPTRPETFARKNLIEQVRTDVRQHFPHHALEVFGSERTGLSFAISDIDLRMVPREELGDVSPKAPSRQQRRRFVDDLYKLRRKLGADDGAYGDKYKNVFLRQARYPLLDIEDCFSGLNVQIVLSNDTSRQRMYMQRYMAEYPYIRQVYAVVKAMLDQRGFTDVLRGGFGSYSIFMMIVGSLQNHPNQRKDAAGALINFLYYWGYFKTREHGVSINPPGYFDKDRHEVITRKNKQIVSKRGTPLPDWMLCLRDPADEDNDLGRKGTSILHVQATLRHLVQQILADLKANTRPTLLSSLLADLYLRERRRREKLTKYGHWIQQRVQDSFAEAEKKEEYDVPATEQEVTHDFLDSDRIHSSADSPTLEGQEHKPV